MRKIGVLFISIILFALSVSSVSAAERTYRVFVHGALSTSNAISQGGSTLVPAKQVLGSLGYAISYDNKTKMTSASKKGTRISFTEGSKTAFVNGTKTALPLAPKKVSGTLYIALKFIVTYSGETMSVDPSTKNIIIGKEAPPAALNIASKPVSTTKVKFRNVKWGMTVAQVKKAETAKLIGSGDGYYYYETKASGMDATLAYRFTNNKLTDAMYIFKVDHINSNAYISDYDSLKSALVGKYGSPDNDQDIVYYGDLYKGDARNTLGTAVAIGQAAFYNMWTTADTEITLALYGDNFDSSLVLQYSGLAYKSEVSNSQNAKAAQGL
ncbi:copper amine oxidase N-terminal domain-containing protein [Paenibacillus rhizovicinus]|uniref:Copper amine oxidase N-terminal domain-containing protein n=1 Tax=Paenibacillus rhizovicinus TaxID=2704463 RepID=A0A6C0P302_9BACL|nr:copper amine oxidase N-terminal domain-containing protein [Paenibacillus rhizovicinus]QHW32835.1 copper amine oxidase N-terminal domain-containing protein [Paenibacillus rhizovicinus]